MLYNAKIKINRRNLVEKIPLVMSNEHISKGLIESLRHFCSLLRSPLNFIYLIETFPTNETSAFVVIFQDDEASEAYTCLQFICKSLLSF